jgi:iron(III) transport system substrate-binding protein
MVAAARQEGKLLIATQSGTAYRKLLDDFQAAFPGITVEHSQFQSSSRDFTPRLLQELKAGLVSWDMMVMPAQEMLRQVRPVDGLQPVRPMIVRPEVLDDKAWRGGFEAGFPDEDKKWGYTGVLHRYLAVWINADMVKDGEVRGIKDLLDPKWKGKIIGGDPRTKGSGFIPATVMRIRTGGDDILKQLYKDQDVLVSTDSRQMTELMVRERYAVGIGAVERLLLDDFQAQGLGRNIKPLDFPDCDFVTSDSNHFWMLNKAAHPNAAGAFINWALTQEGSAGYSKTIGVNSRRADVPPVNESTAITPGVDYVSTDLESFLPQQQKTQELAKALLD